jgi:outer membrane protein TolC
VQYTDLLTATRQLTEAERALIQERYEYLKSWASLEAQVGGEF